MTNRERLNIVLSGLIAALGFSACHHTKKATEPVVTPVEEIESGIMLMYGIPRPEEADTIIIVPDEEKPKTEQAKPESRPKIMLKYGVMPPR